MRKKVTIRNIPPHTLAYTCVSRRACLQVAIHPYTAHTDILDKGGAVDEDDNGQGHNEDAMRERDGQQHGMRALKAPLETHPTRELGRRSQRAPQDVAANEELSPLLYLLLNALRRLLPSEERSLLLRSLPRRVLLHARPHIQFGT